MKETAIGQGISVVETPKRARLYVCNHCDKLIVDTKKKPCPRCGQDVTFVDWLRKDKPLTIIVKGY